MKDKIVGMFILAASLLVLVVYGYILFYTLWDMLALKMTVFIAVLALLLLMAWLGYTLATTPPPASIEAPKTDQKATLTLTKKFDK